MFSMKWPTKSRMFSYNKMKVQLVKHAECSTSNYVGDTNYYQVNTAETKAESVFLSWITQPNGLVTCNTSHIKNHFRACLDFEDIPTTSLSSRMEDKAGQFPPGNSKLF